MKIFHFRAKDRSSDDGYAVVIVKAANGFTANRYLREYLRKMNRTDLVFQLERTANDAVIYSNVEGATNAESTDSRQAITATFAERTRAN